MRTPGLTDRQIERQRDMMKLIVIFLNFANVPKNLSKGEDLCPFSAVQQPS